LKSNLLFSILTNNISILSTKYENKKLFDLKLEIAIPNYYFWFSELLFQFRKLFIEFKHGHFNFESENWHFNPEIFYLNSKTYFI